MSAVTGAGLPELRDALARLLAALPAGQELLLTPSLRPARIRGLASLNEAITSVTGVARVAVNLRGIPVGSRRAAWP